ncbi:rhodanese-like domain-containing protein [Reinekea sp.]|uniref:rhodanese-like domain-containing protein n=1 Tax=Reinekea sp. TaxID=1970455 RepID=UPI002A7F1E74|nr:rhodanese-like domain-containing protein [Reinekea sp.]
MNKPLLLGLLWLCVQWPSAAFSADIDWSTMTIIDVRSAAEWQESHLEGALWIPWEKIEAGVISHQIDKNRPLGFYCAAGVRAARAIRRLEKLGYSQTYNLINVYSAAQVTGRAIIK